jgi:predicted nucleic acid-binding protein
MDKVIISDTSCLIALQRINLLDVLKKLYGEIIITEEVSNEYGGALPDWIIITKVKNTDKQLELERKLDKGEASSIALALEINNSTLIIDEIKGRKIAQSLRVKIIGTIGVLVLANKQNIINDVLGTVLKLVNSGFRMSEGLINKIIDKYGKK